MARLLDAAWNDTVWFLGIMVPYFYCGDNVILTYLRMILLSLVNVSPSSIHFKDRAMESSERLLYTSLRP